MCIQNICVKLVLWDFFSDCSKRCSTGHLNSTCDACICTNITVTGTVRNDDGTLLNNATIALSEFPFNILARTNIAGHLEFGGICVEQEELIVKRSGYIPQLLNAQKIDSTSFKISARLEAIGNDICILLIVFNIVPFSVYFMFQSIFKLICQIIFL